MTRLLVTGGAGFIGSNLVRNALSRGYEVAVLDDMSTGRRDNLDPSSVFLIEGSILNDAALERALRRVDVVVHLAALGSVPRSVKDPLASHAANATGTLKLLEAVRRSPARYVLTASSSSVYGLNDELPKRERGWTRPLSPYAVSKLATEQYTLAYQQSYGFESLAFRFFNVYGPGQRPGHAYAAVVPVFLDCATRGVPVPINGDGGQSRDFTFVDTVTDTILEAIARRVTHPEPVNLAFGTNTTVNGLVDAIGELMNRPIARESRPARPGDVQHSRADNTSLRELFPSISSVPLAHGLSETLEWIRSIGVND